MKKIIPLFILMLYAGFVSAQPQSFLSFNGTDQYMMIPHHDDFNITTSESFTMTGWVKIANYGSNSPRYISKRDNGSVSGDARTGYELFGQSVTNSLGLNTPTNTSGHAYSTYTGVPVQTNTWMHFALVVDHDSDIIRIYQDGSNVKTSGANDPVASWYVNNTNNIYIGAGYYSGAIQYLLNGSMGNVRFYSMALSDTEVTTDKGSNSIANLSQSMRDHLIAVYEMSEDNIHDNQLTDLSGNGHTASMVGYTSATAEISAVTLTQRTGFTGRGNTDEVILKAAVAFGGSNASVSLSSMRLNLNGTLAEDYDNIKVYSTGHSTTFSTTNLIGTVNPTNGDFDCTLDGALASGTNYIWITADVNAAATEGQKIDASLLSISTTEQTFTLTAPSPEGDIEILLARTTLFRPGDYNSQFWRIPAVITAKDGSIVAVTDKRKYSNGDLPQDIDIVSRRSTDGGKTWSEPVTIAQGTGYNHGFGDCALVLGDGEGEIIAGFVGGVGLWNGTPSNPLRHYISRSLDNGLTWSTPLDITDQLYGAGCSISPNNTWQSSFFGSGNGLRLNSGRIMFVAAIRHSANNQTLYNHAVYSDDNGVTWHVSGQASVGGDEAKVTQLDDGRILMSIRHSGYRWFNISSDDGETWGSTQSWNDLYNQSACNGDMIRYTSLTQGYEKNRLLHSFPDYSNGRRNVSVFVSYDEGTSWSTKKCLVPYSSAYSSLCILPDGTIGLYVEEDSDGGDTYDCVFYNFSLSWLTDGADVFIPLDPTSVVDNTAKADNSFAYLSQGELVISNEGHATLQVIDMMGRVVSSQVIDGDARISTNGMKAGMYVIRLDGKTQKVVVR